MSLFDKKGISLASGFDYQAEQPLDSRFICATKAELQKLIDGKAAYKGLVTYCIEDSTLYTFNGTQFSKASQQEEDHYADVLSKIEAAKTDLIGGADSDNNTLKKLADRISNEINDRISAVSEEAKARSEADTAINSSIASLNESKADKTTLNEAKESLQSQIDAINSASDVVDVVATKADLDKYDNSSLTDKDIVKVLKDESNNNQTDYYRFNQKEFVLIGGVGPYYTVSEVNDKVDTINTTTELISSKLNTEIANREKAEKALQGSIDSNASDIAALTTSVAENKGDIVSLKTSVSALQTDNTANKASISDLQSTATATTETVNQVKSDLKAVTEKASANSDSISALQAEDTAIKANVTEIQGKQKESETAISALDTSLSTLSINVTANTSGIVDEKTARTKADETLQSNINTKVAKTTTIAGLSLESNITKEKLLEALGFEFTDIA